MCSLVLFRLCVLTGTISFLCVYWYHLVFVCSLVLPHLCVFIGTISSFVFHWYLLVFVCSLVISRLCVFTGTYSSLCVHWYLFAFVCSPFRFDYCNSLLSALPLWRDFRKLKITAAWINFRAPRMNLVALFLQWSLITCAHSRRQHTRYFLYCCSLSGHNLDTYLISHVCTLLLGVCTRQTLSTFQTHSYTVNVPLFIRIHLLGITLCQ